MHTKCRALNAFHTGYGTAASRSYRRKDTVDLSALLCQTTGYFRHAAVASTGL